MHCQSGLTALKLAQFEGHQDVCDILLQYTQQGSKVMMNPEEESELRLEKAKADPHGAEVSMTIFFTGMLTCQLHSSHYSGANEEWCTCCGHVSTTRGR